MAPDNCHVILWPVYDLPGFIELKGLFMIPMSSFGQCMTSMAPWQDVPFL